MRQAERKQLMLVRAHAWQIVLGVGGALTVLNAVASAPLTKTVAYMTIGVLGLAGIAAGALLNRGNARHWWLIWLGAALWIAGDLIHELDGLRGVATPYPSLADALYVPACFLLLFSLLGLVRGRGRPGLGELLDAAIIAGGFGITAWYVILGPIAAQDATVAQRVVSLVVLSVDVVLAFTLLPLALTGSARTRAFQLLAGAIAVLLAADLIYAIGNLAGTYDGSSWTAAAGAACYTLLGAAALHPSARKLREGSARERLHALTWPRIAFMAGALAAAPVIGIVRAATGHPADVVVLGIAELTAMLFVLMRLIDLWRTRENAESAVRESEARFRSLFENADAARLSLAEHNDRLRELDRMKDEFVALVSHDLRTPLTSIRGYIELLLEGLGGTLNDDQRKWMDVIDRNSARLLRLVADLLFIAQLDAGRISLERSAVMLTDVASEIVEAVAPTAETRKVELRLDAAGTVILNGDRARLGQLIDNLVSNALKFTPPGGRVDVRVGGDATTVWIEIADTGMGISAAEQLHLFERFFRTAAANSAAIQGTGLGLAIAKGIVDAHAGTIAVRSVEGAGTTFRIELPVHKPSTVPTTPTEVTA
jgi:signal transduction histidine kinase